MYSLCFVLLELLILNTDWVFTSILGTISWLCPVSWVQLVGRAQYPGSNWFVVPSVLGVVGRAHAWVQLVGRAQYRGCNSLVVSSNVDAIGWSCPVSWVKLVGRAQYPGSNWLVGPSILGLDSTCLHLRLRRKLRLS